ncbi:hypothetical protein P353_24900 [Comamonas testosteroni]|uniref:Uncharacterized protein n=1 Tax=Comamonas testosteroni TaxID=285 RepID=A0A096H9K9_COMTE|nr:hypothetical protein P353_24900 [Comamonas testosteroni]
MFGPALGLRQRTFFRPLTSLASHLTKPEPMLLAPMAVMLTMKLFPNNEWFRGLHYRSPEQHDVHALIYLFIVRR